MQPLQYTFDISPPSPRRQIDHDTGAYVPTLSNNVRVFFYFPFQLMYKYKGDKAYGFISTSPPNDAYWTELREGVIPTIFFKDQLVCGPAVVWTHGFPALLQLS